MDNPTRWNITNSAQNIVSALVDPSKQHDYAFRREWGHIFSGTSRYKASLKHKQDEDLRSKLKEYLTKLDDRKNMKLFEAKIEARSSEFESMSKEWQSKIAVPEVFLLENFDLSDLHTFNRVIAAVDESKNHELVVSDVYDYISSSQLNGSPVYNYQTRSKHSAKFTKSQLKELQHTFTDYLDIIEDKLASQISDRSGDFFQVMSSVDSIMDELSLAIKSVTSLRRKCSRLNEDLITPNMKSIQLSKARSNAQTVLDRLKDIAYLSKVQQNIQLYLSTSDFVGALDSIAKSRAMLNKNLTRVICLRHLESQLLEVERVIGTMMQQEFVFPFAKSFSSRYNEICERSSLTLLSLLQTQAEIFVNKFHEERKHRIEAILDIEQWKMVEEIPDDFQKLICLIVNEDVSLGDTFDQTIENHQVQNGTSKQKHLRAASDIAMIDHPRIEQDLTSVDGYGTSVISTNRSFSSNLDSLTLSTNANPLVTINRLRYITAGNSTYAIVNSVIIFIRTIMDYCKCAHDIQTLSAELLERLFKILQLYNSKTYHLVYSAGAIQVAGLKTITTRSLVVAQRSLKLIILMLPAIQKHFAQLLPDNSRLRRFDEIRLSYEDHAAKIPERVNLIVRDVINLQLQEWEAKPPVPSNQFNAVAQHLMRLHDNIQDALPEDELRILFLKINQTFKDVLTIHLERLNITSDAGPRQWLVSQELTFYKISLLKFSCFKGWEFSFDDLWTR